MKTSLFLSLAFCSLQVTAADRIVEEFGSSPTYPNIAAAVTAAVDGDRIIIKNRTGDIPWIENITVDKNLDFLSYQDNGFFVVQGNWTITAADGRVINIIGMRNTNGGILATGTAPIGSARLRIMDSQFVNGSINLTSDAIRAELVGNELQAGFIRINIGKVVGNSVTYTAAAQGIRIAPTTTTFLGDTSAIIGNRVNLLTYNYAGISVTGRAQVYHIRNNWVRHSWMGIEVQGGNTQAIANLVQNNSIQANIGGTGTRYGISMANTVSNCSNWGINKDSGNGGQINVYFNHVASSITSSISPGFTYEGSNTTNQPLTFNTDGTFSNAPAAVNGGNPAAPFFDLDLSIGDAGAYGGSYTLNNFPLHTGAARVYMTGHPFNLRSGATLRVRANAWDR